MFVLSNPKDEDLMHVCDHDHSDLGIECENVFQCLDNYHSYITSITKDGMAKMENWFGKRGISGHVHSFIMKEGTNFKSQDG